MSQDFKRFSTFWVICFFTSVLKLSYGQNRLINLLIDKNYDPSIPPLIHDSVLVNTSFRIFSFEAVDNQLNLDVDFSFCLKWRDSRIKKLEDVRKLSLTIPDSGNWTGQLILLTEDYENRFWLPQVYFRNAISSELVNNLQYLEVYPLEKTLNLCTRIEVIFTCWFILSNFPFDEHYCYFELQTFGTSIPSVRLNVPLHPESPGHNQQFVVRESLIGKCDPKKSVMNVFQEKYFHQLQFPYNENSCIYSGLRIVRHVNYYIIRYYLLSFLQVCISFVEFWYPVAPYSANGRMILTVATLANIIGLSQQAYDEVPCKDVASLYWWMWGCQFFVYLALCEFGFAYSWHHYIVNKKLAHQQNIPSPDGYYFGKNGLYKRCGEHVQNFLHRIYGRLPFRNDPVNRNKVDYVARILFPSALLFYTLIYIVSTIPAWVSKY